MNNDRLYLIYISEYIRRIEIYTYLGRDDFLQSIIIQDAVIRNFENIGESSKHLSQELKQRYSDIPWRRIAGFKNILAHDYLNVDMEEVCNVIENDLPDLKSKIEIILRDIEVK